MHIFYFGPKLNHVFLSLIFFIHSNISSNLIKKKFSPPSFLLLNSFLFFFVHNYFFLLFFPKFQWMFSWLFSWSITIFKHRVVEEPSRASINHHRVSSRRPSTTSLLSASLFPVCDLFFRNRHNPTKPKCRKCAYLIWRNCSGLDFFLLMQLINIKSTLHFSS